MPTVQSIQKLNELGIQGVELTIQPNELTMTFERQFSMSNLPVLLNSVQSGQLHVYSVHAPAISAERCYNLWARQKFLAQSIEICNLLGGGIVVIHPYHLFRTHEDALSYLTGKSTSLNSYLLPGINEVLDLAYSTGIMLALENIQDWQDEIFFNSPQNVLRFFKDIDHPSFGFTFDILHAQVAGTIDEFIDTLAEEIVNMHAADFSPPAKRVAIGKGIIDWRRLPKMIQSFSNLRQVTVELSNPQPSEIAESVSLLSSLIFQ